MRLAVDKVLCEGYGKCVRIAPDLFRLDEAHIACVLIEGDLTAEQLQSANIAVRLCPTKAISLVDVRLKGEGD